MTNRNLKWLWGIVVIALLLVVVILVLSNQSFKSIERAALDEFNQRQLALAREGAGGVELYFETLAGDMKALGRRPEVQQLDEVPTRREMQHTFDKLEPLGVNDIGVLDANGVLRYNVVAPQIEGDDFSWRRYYQEAKGMTSGDAYIAEFIDFKGADVGRKGVLIAVPMFETSTGSGPPASLGEFAGVVVCTLELDTLTQRFVAPIKSSTRGHALLIDDEYTALWAPDKSLFGNNLLEEGHEFPAFQHLLGRMSAGNSGTAEYSYYRFEDFAGMYARDEAEEQLMAYAPVHLGNDLWSIGVWAPVGDARRLIQSGRIAQLSVVGLSILVVVLGAAVALAILFRINKFLEREIEAKTKELHESQEKLLAAVDHLETAHAFQQSIIDGVAEPIMVIGADHQVRLMNRAAREFWAGDVDASRPLLCHEVSHQSATPCDGVGHPCPIEQVRESGQPVTLVHEHYRADGRQRFVEIVASPLSGADGTFHGIIEATRDITERKRMEEMLGQQVQALGHSNDELEQFAYKLMKSIQVFFERLPSD